MTIATVTSKGQTTVPGEIRERLRLRPGDRIDFVVLPDGSVRFVAVNLPMTALQGILPPPKRAASVEEMNRAIARAASRAAPRRR